MELIEGKSFYYKIKQGDNLTTLCKNFNTCKENILRNNPDLDFYVGEWVKIKVNDFKTHIVKPAETLSNIADKYNTTIQKIIEKNNLNSNHLFIGQTLKIY